MSGWIIESDFILNVKDTLGNKYDFITGQGLCVYENIVTAAGSRFHALLCVWKGGSTWWAHHTIRYEKPAIQEMAPRKVMGKNFLDD